MRRWKFACSAASKALCLLILCSTVQAADGVWKVRDVTAHGAFVDQHPTLKLEAKFDGERASCTVIDTTAGERAVTLAFCLPLDAIGGTWCDDPQTTRRIEAAATQPYQNCSDRAGGMMDEASTYPLAVVIEAASDNARVLACPPDVPRMVRFVYDAAAKELRAEFDFGLSPVPEKFPSRADAAVIRYQVPAKWAFRRALQKYYELFPQAFVRRNKAAGIWLPFSEIGHIENARDFGFAFHELGAIDPRILSDDEKAGAGSYVYVEPQSYWQTFKGQGKGTYDQRLAQLEADAAAGDKAAAAAIVSGVIRAGGKRDLYMEGAPYTPQLPWGMNPDPLLANGKGSFEFDRIESLLGWRDKPNPGLEGVYVDSMEGWGEIKDYDKNHWRVTQFPLTFDPVNDNKVALLNFWATCAWVREMSRRLHDHEMILFGNDAFYRRWQLAAWVDVPGREYTWLDATGKLTPVEDARYLFLRAMSARRPYLMLMNNKFDDGSIIEPYFQRNLFYGVFPSFYQANRAMNEVSYFDNPAWYNRDRGLFKKSIPLIHKLDAAGWEPVPFASAEPDSIRIERWGNAFFTVQNTANAPAKVTLTIDRRELHLESNIRATEQITGKHIDCTPADDMITLRFDLAAGGYGMIALERAK